MKRDRISMIAGRVGLALVIAVAAGVAAVILLRVLFFESMAP